MWESERLNNTDGFYKILLSAFSEPNPNGVVVTFYSRP